MTLTFRLLAASLTVCALSACNSVGQLLPKEMTYDERVALARATIPAAGAAVGTGNSYSRVRVSPSASDVGLLGWINEIRTCGTVNGQDVISGS